MAGRVLLASAAASAVATAVSVLDGGRCTVALAGCTAAWSGGGAVLHRICAPPATLRPAGVQAAVLAAWLLFIAVGTVTYLACGTFDRPLDAVFESTAGFTTTALSVLEPVEGVPKGVLFWRAATQWLGGFAAVLVVVALLPLLGVGGVEAEGGLTERRGRLRSPQIMGTARRLVQGYLALSLAGVALFAAAGMGPFDAVTYAMTTISSGGFGNHEGSIGFFDSALIEWATIGGMVLAGANLMLLLAALQRRPAQLRRSVELRAYLAVLALSSAALVAWTVPDTGLSAESARHAVFAAASAMSTTGHTVGGWAGWGTGPLVLLMLLAGVGAMSGAPGGGFRQVRAMALLGVVRREIVRQLHPRSVVVVKVGATSVDERVVSHMIGYQVAWLVLVGAGALALGAAGLEVGEALTGAVTAVATYGPALGQLRAGAEVLPDVGLVVLVPLMLAGRLEISPVATGVAALIGWRPGRAADRRRRR